MPDQQVAPVASARRIAKYFIVGLLAIIAALVVALNFILPVFFHRGSGTTARATNLPADLPAPTAADTAAAQKGFQHLVAYTAAGYRPASLAVKQGETVRFTNTTDAPIRIILGDTSSPGIESGQYWEQTFNGSGSVPFATGEHTGTVTVQ